MRELLDHLLSCIVTVRRRNTAEWMQWMADEMNKALKEVGDPDRIVCDERGGLRIIRNAFASTGTNHHCMPIGAKESQ